MRSLGKGLLWGGEGCDVRFVDTKGVVDGEGGLSSVGMVGCEVEVEGKSMRSTVVMVCWLGVPVFGFLC